MTIGLSARRITCVLIVLALCLCAASMAGQCAKYFLGHDQLLGLVPMFDLNGEANVPTWYSSSILIFSSFLLALIAYMKKKDGDRYFLHWAILALVFLFLSLDETANIHDFISDRMHPVFHTRGILFYAWVIPYAILTII